MTTTTLFCAISVYAFVLCLGQSAGQLCLSCSFRRETSTSLTDDACVTSPLSFVGSIPMCSHGCMIKATSHPALGFLSFTRGCAANGSAVTPLTCTTSPWKIRTCDMICNNNLCNRGSASSLWPTAMPPTTSAPPSIVTSGPPSICTKESLPRDCGDVLDHDVAASTGRYYIYPAGVRMSVWCDMDTAGGGWTVFQRRFDGSVDFFLTWDEYKEGFGKVNGGEFWLGNNFIHTLTYARTYMLRLDMADVNGPSVVEFEHFAIGDEANRYKLSVATGTPSSTAGPASLLDHNGYSFSTKDKDYDSTPTRSCAGNYKGGWWYHDCHKSGLNQLYTYNTGNKRALNHSTMHYDQMKNGITSGFPLRLSQMKVRAFYRPKDCWDIHVKYPRAGSGVYTVYPGLSSAHTATAVFCDMVTDGGGWTTILRRYDGSVDFYRNFKDYENGIGDVYGEHWLGLRNIHNLGKQRKYELRVDVESNKEKKFAKYSRFSLGDVTDIYRLHVTGYDHSSTAGDSLSAHNKLVFSAKDKNQGTPNCGNCPLSSKGGWWYDCCHKSNLLGSYDYKPLNQGHVTSQGQSMIWASFLGQSYSLKAAHMKLRPQLPCATGGGAICTGSKRCFNDLTRGIAVCH